MGSRVLVSWECERCGALDEGAEIGYQPKGWISIRVATPPKSAEPLGVATLCRECDAALRAWLRRDG